MSKDKNDVVIINLDRPRELKFNHTALKTLVAMTGKTIEELDMIISPSNFDLVEELTYCGLLKDAKENGETLTLEKIPELLDQSQSFAYNIEKLFSAWRVAFGAPAVPEGNPEPVEQPAKEKRSTGKKA